MKFETKLKLNLTKQLGVNCDSEPSCLFPINSSLRFFYCFISTMTTLISCLFKSFSCKPSRSGLSFTFQESYREKPKLISETSVYSQAATLFSGFCFHRNRIRLVRLFKLHILARLIYQLLSFLVERYGFPWTSYPEFLNEYQNFYMVWGKAYMEPEDQKQSNGEILEKVTWLMTNPFRQVNGTN